MIYTSRYSNPELKSGKYVALSISSGSPRWKLPYVLSGSIDFIKPGWDLVKLEKKYKEKLETVGIEKIKQSINQFREDGKDVVLLCYEDIRKGDEDWCHRTMFAKWWSEKGGEEIKELHDPSEPKIPKKKKIEVKDKADNGNSQVLFDEFSSMARYLD
ncbi:MAG: hypothetical protein RR965_05070 [Enterococcus sp.]